MKHFFANRFSFSGGLFFCCTLLLTACGLEPVFAAPKLAVRVKVTGIAGKAAGANQKFKLTWGAAEEFAGGNWSGWSAFTGYNGEGLYASACTVEPIPAVAPFPRLKLEVETSIE